MFNCLFLKILDYFVILLQELFTLILIQISLLYLIAFSEVYKYCTSSKLSSCYSERKLCSKCIWRCLEWNMIYPNIFQVKNGFKKMFKVRITSFCDFLVIWEAQKQTGRFLKRFLFGNLEIFACIWDRLPKMVFEVFF